GALPEEEPAEIAIRPDLAALLRARHHASVRIDLLGHQRLRARELVVVGGLRGELELADALEVAIDALLRDQRLDLVHARVERPIEHVGALEPELLRKAVVVLREAVIAHAAI